MYKLDQAELLVEYYKPILLEKEIKPLQDEGYLIMNVVFAEIIGGTFNVYCVCNEGKEILSRRDIERVANDHGLLSPTQVLKQYNL
ncbi:hypothetical protein ACHRVW_10000 [Flavobacterium collinsii]|uniref:hypothetical protein n=1 Tax=Flavobacterium collinsii TaxID=1114861 RepID=UPI003757D410